jgi:hypothetical protein
MRRSSWTPSIVPNGDDHNVYLVMHHWRAGPGLARSRGGRASKRSFACWLANIKPGACGRSTPPRNGRTTYRRRRPGLRRRCDPPQRGVCVLRPNLASSGRETRHEKGPAWGPSPEAEPPPSRGLRRLCVLVDFRFGDLAERVVSALFFIQCRIEQLDGVVVTELVRPSL